MNLQIKINETIYDDNAIKKGEDWCLNINYNLKATVTSAEFAMSSEWLPCQIKRNVGEFGMIYYTII